MTAHLRGGTRDPQACSNLEKFLQPNLIPSSCRAGASAAVRHGDTEGEKGGERRHPGPPSAPAPGGGLTMVVAVSRWHRGVTQRDATRSSQPRGWGPKERGFALGKLSHAGAALGTVLCCSPHALSAPPPTLGLPKPRG